MVGRGWYRSIKIGGGASSFSRISAYDQIVSVSLVSSVDIAFVDTS
jgi:hypothetical protein